jgi:hypothetical protein
MAEAGIGNRIILPASPEDKGPACGCSGGGIQSSAFLAFGFRFGRGRKAAFRERYPGHGGH